ncbi:helix-turn-helix transcriptional regulator [Paracoccus sp. 12-3]|nr:helix-turn-helix transcriptional regulator [Paracoccus xiamenensis]
MEFFAPNLRLLCSYKPSISRVASDLDINRSQLNRYLAGSSFPRRPLLRRICDYFGVEPHEIVLPQTDFSEIVRLRGLDSDRLAHRVQRHLDQIRARGDRRVLELTGSFFEYYYSMSQRGRIVRSLVVFAPEGEHVFYRRLERMGPFNRPGRRHHRYQGSALLLGDRIFLNDYEYDSGIELTQSVLYPDYTHTWTCLHGVKIGVSANRNHTPCSVRTYFERAAPGLPLIGHLRRCGVFAADSPDIPPHIPGRIDNTASGPHVFDAWSGSRD